MNKFSIEEIIDLIGETTEYEKKVTLEEKDPESWLKSVSAFANTNGGFIIFGIDDNDNLVGINDPKKLADKISDYINNYIDPHPITDLQYETIVEQGNRYHLVILYIYPGSQTPYYYSHKKSKKAFMRVNNSSIPCDKPYLDKLILKGSNLTYDRIESKYKLNDLSFNYLKRKFKERENETIDISKDIESFGLLADDGFLNNGGVLLSDENPTYDSRVFCTRWNGLNKGTASLDAIDDRELDHQSILEQLDNAIKFVESNSKKPWKKTDDNRIEMPDYPSRAVEEGLVNALIHRDYTLSGCQIDVFMYDDRLEINSPGGMFGGSIVQKLNLRKVPSRRRNPQIADVFTRFHYMERKGSGFGKILDAYLNAPNNLDNKIPEFESDNTDFRLILPNLNYVKDSVFDNSDIINIISDNLKGKQKIVYDAICANNGINKSSLAQKTGLSSNEVKNAIDKLVDKKLIKYVGDNSVDGKYYIENNTSV